MRGKERPTAPTKLDKNPTISFLRRALAIQCAQDPTRQVEESDPQRQLRLLFESRQALEEIPDDTLFKTIEPQVPPSSFDLIGK